MGRISRISVFLCMMAVTLGCQESPENSSFTLSEAFKEYWYAGTAELSSYRLSQARYGSVHEGMAHLVFVTEDFSRRRKVKTDDQGEGGADITSVLKLNEMRTFQTGIYDYRQMVSVFSDLHHGNPATPLKITMSSQDWCGQTFMQYSLDKAVYDVELRSYFDSEGDKDKTLAGYLTEDGIWNSIRIDPAILPVGRIDMIPSTLYLRLRHREADAYPAEASLRKEGQLTTYTIIYPDLERTVSITFATDFPHLIERWKEVVPSGFGDEKTLLTTSAERINTLRNAYWQIHGPEDTIYRDQLDHAPNAIR